MAALSGGSEPERREFDALPLVVASVGTDHHPFDRLVGWVDTYARQHREIRVMVQRGTADPPRSAESEPTLPHGELRGLFAAATAVVCHAGPSTIMDARAAGRLPIVVPRDPARGEHVDDHQIRFADHLDRLGIARIATGEAHLGEVLAEALAHPDRFVVPVGVAGPAGIATFGRVLDGLLGIETPAAIAPEEVRP